MDIETIYKEYFSIVYSYILSLSHNSLTAEEITQETFFKAMKKIDSFRGESSIRVWLCQIAKNLYYDYVKRQGRYESLPADYGQQIASMEEEYILKSDLKSIYRILHGLREPYKEVFSLRMFGELSFSDIAELFGRTDSWARVTFHRAKLMIKEEYENGTNNT